MTAPAAHSILLTSADGLDAGLSAAVSEGIEKVFGFATAARPFLTDLSFAFDPNREQYHSTSILQRMADACPPWAVKVLALVAVDLYIPILTHVYGEAQLGGRTCIVSTFRLVDEPWRLDSPQRLRQRLVKESIHELGHTFNLRHCPEPKCCMHYCRSQADVDLKAGELCRYCRILLQDELKKPMTF